MPNIKSSIRSVKTDAERRVKNAPIKAALRNASRKVEALTKTGAKEDAQATMATASGLLDKACLPPEYLLLPLHCLWILSGHHNARSYP